MRPARPQIAIIKDKPHSIKYQVRAPGADPANLIVPMSTPRGASPANLVVPMSTPTVSTLLVHLQLHS